MNHVYRSVWNEVSRTFVAVAETVRRKAKTSTAEPAGGDGVVTEVNGVQRKAAGACRPGLVRSGLRPMALEQRFMFDGAAVATVDAAHVLPDASARALMPEVPAAVEVRTADPVLNSGRKEVAFVDTSLADYRSLEAGIRAGIEVVEIDGLQHGLAQLALWAGSHGGYDAIHIYSHGDDGAVYLGRDALTTASLSSATVQAEMATLGHALKSGGDLMLYGCDVAAGSAGQQFIEALQRATGADVAASTDATGAAALGGNWTLERAAGQISTVGAALGTPDYQYLLGTVSVTAGTSVAGTSGADNFVPVGSSSFDAITAIYDPTLASEDQFTTSNVITNFQAATDKLLFTNYDLNISSFSFESQSRFLSFGNSYRDSHGLNPSYTSMVIVTPGKLSSGVASTTAATGTDGAFVVVFEDVGYQGFTFFLSGVNYSDLALTNFYAAADTTAPTVSSVARQTPSSSPTNADTLTWRVTFSESVSNVGSNDFTLSGPTGATLTVTSVDGTSYDVTASGGNLASYGGTATLSFAGTPTIQDGAGNALVSTSVSGSNVNTYVLDNTAPTVASVVRQSPSSSATNADSLTWRVTFSEAVSSVGSNDFTLSGPTGATLTATSVDGTSYDVTASGGNLAGYDGTVTLSFAGTPTIADSVGNALVSTAVSGSNANSYVLDNTAPTVNSVVRQTPSGSATNADSLTWRVTFSEAVANVGSNDFTLNGPTGATLTVTSVDGSSYDVTASGGNLASYDGTVTLSFAGTPTVQDGAGNALVSTAVSGTNANSYVLDNTAPTVSSVVRQTPSGNPTNADSVTWRVTFTEAVSNVGSNDFTLSGPSGATLTVTSVDGSTWDVTASGGNLAGYDGTVTLGFAGTPTIEDGVGNALVSTAVSGTNANSYVLDNTAPTVSSVVRQTPGSNPTNADSVTWRVTFSEAVANVGSNDFTLSGPTGATLTVTSVDGTSYDVTASGGNLASYDGTVTLSFAGTPTIQDGVGNALASAAVSGTNANSYVLDNTAPVVSSIERRTSHVDGATREDSVTWRVTFSEAVSGVGAGDFQLSGGTGAGLTVVEVIGSDGTQYDVTASGGTLGSHDGAVTLSFAAGYGVQDLVGNAQVSTAVAGTNDAGYTLDNTAPVVSSIERLTSHVDGATNEDSLSWRVTFSEAVSGVVAGDFQLGGGTGATLTLVEVAGSDGTQYDVTASGGTLVGYDGAVTLSFADGYGVQDLVGNTQVSTTVAGTNDAGYTLDNTTPEVSSIERRTSHVDGATNEDSLTWRVTFSEAVSGVDAEDFQLGGGTGATLTVVEVAGSNGTQYDVTASGGTLGSHDGAVTLSFADGYGVQDLVGNAQVSTAVAGANDAGYTLDNTVPEVSSVERRTSHVDGATNANTLTWRVTFSEAVSGVGASDFQLSGVTGATLQVVEVAGSNGTQYDVTASGEALVSHDGLVTLSFATDYTVQDLVGNAQASTAVAGTNDAAYALDNTAPVEPTLTTSLTNDATPVLGGTAEAGSVVEVTVGGASFRITADASGEWLLDTSDTRLIVDGSFALGLDGAKAVTVRSTDAVGNSRAGSGEVVLDTTAPTAPTVLLSEDTGVSSSDWLTRASALGLSGRADADTTVTVDWGDGFAAILAERDGTGWSIGTWALSEGTHTVTVTATDAAGNSSQTVRTLVVDTTGPTVTPGAIRVSGATGTNGTFRIGDAVVATWDDSASGDHNSEPVVGVTMNFAWFGGFEEVQATLSDGVWTARYTIVAGDSDWSGARVDVSAMDSAGNVAWAADEALVAVDNEAPVIFSSWPTLSGATGSNGVFKIGDVVTVSWLPPVPGYTDYDLVDGMRVDFASFGGGQVAASFADGVWTARYTIVAGSIESSNCLVSLIVTDDAGNEARSDFEFDRIVDNTRPVPVLPSLSVDENAPDNGFVGDLAQPGITHFELLDDAGGRFTLVSDLGTLYVTSGAWLDHEQADAHTITVRMTDTVGNTADVQVRIAVLDVNEAPTAQGDQAQALEAGGDANATHGLDPRGNVLDNDSDPDDGDALRVMAVRAGDGGLEPSAVTPHSTWEMNGTAIAGRYGTLVMGANGSYVYHVDNTNAAVQAAQLGGEPLTDEFSYVLTDAAGLTSHATLTLTVRGANDAPSQESLMDEQAAIQGSPFSFTVPAEIFADVDAGDTQSWSATLADGSALPSWLRFDAHTHTFTGTPANGDVGELQVRVTVRDAAGAAADGDFTLRVANANDAPTLEVVIGDQAATEDGAFSFTVPAETFADMDAGERFTWSATLLDGSALPAWLSFDAATRTFTGTPPNGAAEVLQLRVTVRDVAGAQAHGDFTLRVTSVNDVPTLQNAIADQAATEDGAFGFTVPAETFADVDAGDTQLWSATLVDGSALPSWLHFDVDTHTFTGTPANGDVGELQVRVTVRDAAGAAVHGDFTLRVSNVNDTPTPAQVLAGQTATEDAAFRFAVPAETFADVDADDTRTWSATLADGSALPSWLRFDPVTHTFTGTPADGDVGELQVRVTVRDAAGAAAHGDFTLRVANVNDAPTGGVTIAGSVAIGQVVRASSTVADADGMGPVTYRWLSSLDGQSWTVIEGATGDSLTIGSGLAGRLLRVELIYTDGHGTTEVVSSTPSDRVPPVPPPPVQPPSAPVLPPVPPSLTFPPAPAPASRDTGPSFLPPGSSLGNPNVDTLTRGDASVTTSNGNSGSNQQQQGNQPVLTDGSTPKLTQTGDSSSFRVVVLPSAAAAGAEGLVLNRGVADQVVAPSNGTAQITIPADAFAHTDPNAVVKLNARQANGEALPPWLSFDAATGKFTVRAAPGERRTIEVRVEARDGSNRTVFTTFKIQVGGPTKRTTQLEPAGRPGLSTQLRMAAERQQVPLGRLDQLARLAKRPAAELVKG